MSPRREGDMPGYLRMSPQLKQVAIDSASEHLAASAFEGHPEILLSEGDTDAQWSTMYQDLMEETFIPQVDRSYLHQQRDNLQKWIRLSVSEIKKKASQRYPDISLEAQLVELPEGRGPGRPPLDPKEAERRRLIKEASPTRGRGRPTLTDEEKADAAAQRLLDPSRPTLGRPSGTTKVKLSPPSPNIKIISGQRMRKFVEPIERVELEAAKLAGQDPRTITTIEALKVMLEDGRITPARYFERLTDLLGEEDWKYASDIVATLRSSTVPDKPTRLFVRQVTVDESADVISSQEGLDQFLQGLKPQSLPEEELPVIEQSIVEEDLDDPRLYQ